MVAMTTPDCCRHIVLSGTARFGHPLKSEEAVCKRRASLAGIPESLGLVMRCRGRAFSAPPSHASKRSGYDRRHYQHGIHQTAKIASRSTQAGGSYKIVMVRKGSYDGMNQKVVMLGYDITRGN